MQNFSLPKDRCPVLPKGNVGQLRWLLDCVRLRNDPEYCTLLREQEIRQEVWQGGKDETLSRRPFS